MRWFSHLLRGLGAAGAAANARAELEATHLQGLQIARVAERVGRRHQTGGAELASTTRVPKVRAA